MEKSILSIKELEILKLVSDGLTASEIAEKQYLSTSTIKKHQESIKSKLGARNIMHAVKLGLEEFKKLNYIIKDIEFPPDFVEVGLSLINQFARIITKKYPLNEIKVNIEQEGTKIKFLISAKDGKILEFIEHDLLLYKEILNGKRKPDEIINDPTEILLLEQKIKLISLELKMTREILAISSQKDMNLIQSHEQDKMILFNIINKVALNTHFNHEKIYELSGVSPIDYEKIARSIDDLKLTIELQENNSEKIIQALDDIHKVAPKKSKKVGEYIISFVSEASQTVIKEWIKHAMK